jgi:fibronectin-binding autotransporter adhesin
MKTMTKTTPRATAALFATLAFAVSAPLASAANKSWTGAADANWSSVNWGTGIAAPVAGDNVRFGGKLIVSNNNDLTAGLSFNQLRFTNTNTGTSTGAFTIGGNNLTVSSNVLTTGNAALQTTATTAGSLTDVINLNVNFSAATAGIWTDTGHNLTVNGILSGTNVTKLGTGTLALNGANSYTGTTTVSAGTLELDSANSLFDSSFLTVASGATLNLNFSGTEVIQGLTIAGTIVDLTTAKTVADLNALALGATFTGTGSLGLTASTIPEPSTYAAVAGLGILGFVASRRRRSAA